MAFIYFDACYNIVVNDEIFSRITKTSPFESFLLNFNIFLKNVISTLWIFYAIILDAGNKKEVDQQSVEWMKKKKIVMRLQFQHECNSARIKNYLKLFETKAASQAKP